MFTLHDIKEAHAKVSSGADFPQYIHELRHLGVAAYSTYVSDGHTDYFGEGHYHIQSDARYAPQEIADHADIEQFSTQLKRHQQGGTSYPRFCMDCAAAGVERWTVDMTDMTCTYYDKAGNKMLVEEIPRPA
jgi:uncharacterized protein YbcV (DUF1398 family)